MKLVGLISTAVLSLTLVAAAPVYAQEQQEKQEEKGKPAQQEEKKAQPEKKAQQEKPARQEEKGAQEEKNTGQQKKVAQQQEKNNKQQEEKNAQQQKREPQAKPVQQAQRGGGGRIPDARYKANFGQQHRFHVSQADYSRDRRFQYGGYWFGFVDPWPSNWLYTQDVFVVDIDGVYYLCNPMYPGVNIALSVTL
jgi:hypothetical protein